MMKENKTVRTAISGVLLLTVVAVGVTMYHGNNSKDEMDSAREIKKRENEVMMESEGVSSDNPQAENIQILEDIPEELQNYPFLREEIKLNETKPDQKEILEQKETISEPEEKSVTLNFTDEDVLAWPVNGEVIMDYNMSGTVYYETLDQYRYHEAVLLNSENGEPVQVAANGKVSNIKEDPKTGITVTLDMGNGYETVYGQLKDVLVEQGQSVEKGTILGYVNDPTKYYVKEGTNLYFALKKDGKFLDPMMYIDSVTE